MRLQQIKRCFQSNVVWVCRAEEMWNFHFDEFIVYLALNLLFKLCWSRHIKKRPEKENSVENIKATSNVNG